MRHKPSILAVIVSIVLLAASLVWFIHKRQTNTTLGDFDVNSVLPPPITQPPSPQGGAGGTTQISAAQLKAADGLMAHKCWVVVDGTVYEIKQGLLWNNGQHDTSNGQAYCGADFSEAIKQSPHGKSKLSDLTVVGTYRP